MFEVMNLSAGYFGSQVLHDISISCEAGITLVVGPNGAGKSTLVNSLNGILRPVSGKILFDGKDLSSLRAHYITKEGVSTVPERGRFFSEMTVTENIMVAFESSGRGVESIDETLRSVFALFPDLKEKEHLRAGTLSGGQQQMLSIARALASRPKFLIMDEPTTGLFPKLVKELLLKIREISKGMPILITEQNMVDIVPIATRVYLIESGKIVFSGSPEETISNPEIKSMYFGYKGGK